MSLTEQLTIYVCDDEPTFLSVVEDSVRRVIPNGHVKSFLSARAMLDILQSAPCDILLLDIDMPEISGLVVAKELLKMPEKPLLVFVTNHDELVYDSLLYHPFGFIRKNFFEKEIVKMMTDCVTNIAEKKRHIHFKCVEGDIRLLLTDILYFEGDGNYLRIHTTEKEYRLRDTISAVENTLADDGFVRTHKGFLINQAAVKILLSGEVELYGGQRVPVGKSYAETAKKRLMRYMMR